MKNISEALAYIISLNAELEAIDILLKSHSTKHKSLYDDCHSAKSSLRAIHKINASNNKDKQSAIEELSEV